VALKGITPVIAVVLLLWITVGAVATVYTTITETQRQVANNADINFATESIRLQTCYEEGGRYHLNLRNSGGNPINASKASLSVDGNVSANLDVSQDIVQPGDTFEMITDIELGRDRSVSIYGKSEEKIVCSNLPPVNN